MLKWIAIAAVALAIVIGGLSLVNTTTGDSVTASTVLTVTGGGIEGYTRALQPLDWQFPRDYGTHPDYQTEWWYYTGNLQAEDGRRFGYQFTVFRRAIAPGGSAGDSEWRADQAYSSHFALTDVQGNRFYHEERFSRGAADLAGAQGEPYRVWLEDWQTIALDPQAEGTRITAQMSDESGGAAVDFTLSMTKPPALQGDRGLSAKSAEPGNASHYYSLTRLTTEGTITLSGETFAVTGATWKDHEFSTSALGAGALGWDWFGLQFDDNRELMIGQIRQMDGGRDPYFGGVLVEPDGSTVYLPSDSFVIENTATWTSPHTGATYPAGWRVTVTPPGGEAFTFTATPLLADQELHGGGIAYWEGAVSLSGGVTGYGYAELTGYADALTGRF